MHRLVVMLVAAAIAAALPSAGADSTCIEHDGVDAAACALVDGPVPHGTASARVTTPAADVAGHPAYDPAFVGFAGPIVGVGVAATPHAHVLTEVEASASAQVPTSEHSGHLVLCVTHDGRVTGLPNACQRVDVGYGVTRALLP